jgi:ribosomal protein S18 acetylase RimI-like enzyme
MPGDLDLRPVAEDDWELWRDLRLRVLATDPNAFGSTLAREQAFTEADWRHRLGRDQAIVAWLAGRPVGMGGCVREEPGSWSVVAMWVDPAVRGLGIGRRVLQRLLEDVPADAEVRLWVADGNPARRLYAKAGFAGTGETAPLRAGSSVTKSRMELRGRRTRNVLPRPSSDSTRMLPE